MNVDVQQCALVSDRPIEKGLDRLGRHDGVVLERLVACPRNDQPLGGRHGVGKTLGDPRIDIVLLSRQDEHRHGDLAEPRPHDGLGSLPVAPEGGRKSGGCVLRA